nr:uncharacterized protein K02A2.6-like [Onthophagus taurus]
MILNNYNYDITYKPGKENQTADVLPRLPLKEKTETTKNEKIGLPKYGHLLHLRVKNMPMTQKEIRIHIQRDEILRQQIRYIKKHWPDKDRVKPDLRSFYEKREELSCEEDLILWKGRKCIPKSLQYPTLKMLHDGHPGITAMQSIARLHVYWQNIDADIEKYVQGCQTCQSSKQDTQHLLGLEWSRIHLDFVGPFEGKMWMIIVDAYSKWIEFEEMNNITTASTIKVMKTVFARFGWPKTLVTDNGPQLVSSDFEDFCKSQGIKHVRITPYHPKSNGQAERVVKTFKDRLNSSDKNLNLHDRLCKFLMSYRNTPQRETGRTPSELMFGRPARIIFD